MFFRPFFQSGRPAFALIIIPFSFVIILRSSVKYRNKIADVFESGYKVIFIAVFLNKTLKKVDKKALLFSHFGV
jgi:hypothetical protein